MNWKILFTSLLGTKLKQGKKKHIRQSNKNQTPLMIRLQDRTEKKFDILRWAEKFEATKLEIFLDKIAHILAEVALFRILGVLSNLALLVAVVTWFFGRESRLQEKHYQAWAVINTAAAIMPGCENAQLTDASITDCQIIQGSTGEGGRLSAIEGLHKDKQILEGLNVVGAYLREIDLSPKCFLVFLNCHSVHLSKANFEGVDLSKANLQGARLDAANLKRARLFRSNLTAADLTSSNLEKAILIQANMSEAELNNINLDQALLLDTILTNANKLQASQLDNAYICGVQLPDYINLEPDRNCEEVELMLAEEYAWLNNQAAARKFIQNLRDEFSW